MRHVLVEDLREELPYTAKKAWTFRFLLRLRRRGRLNDGIDVNLLLRGLSGWQIRRGLRGRRRRDRFRGTILCTEDKRRIDLDVYVIRLRCRERGRSPERLPGSWPPDNLHGAASISFLFSRDF